MIFHPLSTSRALFKFLYTNCTWKIYPFGIIFSMLRDHENAEISNNFSNNGIRNKYPGFFFAEGCSFDGFYTCIFRGVAIYYRKHLCNSHQNSKVLK